MLSPKSLLESVRLALRVYLEDLGEDLTSLKTQSEQRLAVRWQERTEVDLAMRILNNSRKAERILP